LDYLGYCIYFWVGDSEELVHVHVSKGNPSQDATKVWIKANGIELAHNHSNIPSKDLKQLMTFINENKNKIIVQWTLKFNSAHLKM
ncbi:MAG: DUF4160 domain-containing protein, partial [Selenomonadaceae bacterium]|nr:DUF4160 domain-containing protein [Selenomonadaceae bacterium]